MTKNTLFPPLTNFEPTRETLHWYAKAVGVLPRVHAEAHPKWWHVSLKVRSDGLYTEPMGLPDGGTLRVKMDLDQHKVVFLVDDDASVMSGAEHFKAGHNLWQISTLRQSRKRHYLYLL